MNASIFEERLTKLSEVDQSSMKQKTWGEANGTSLIWSAVTARVLYEIGATGLYFVGDIEGTKCEIYIYRAGRTHIRCLVDRSLSRRLTS